MLTFDETDRCTCDGYWTNLYSGLVFADKDGNSGSLYRDVYDDDKDYCKRSALHSEVIPLFCRYLELEEKEHHESPRVSRRPVGLSHSTVAV